MNTKIEGQNIIVTLSRDSISLNRSAAIDIKNDDGAWSN